MQTRFPDLKLVGRRNGFFDSVEAEKLACEEIAALAPRYPVGFDGCSARAAVRRAQPQPSDLGRCDQDVGRIVRLRVGHEAARAGMDAAAGLEWLWRASLEPKRLGWRYLKTNPSALYLLLTRSG